MQKKTSGVVTSTKQINITTTVIWSLDASSWTPTRKMNYSLFFSDYKELFSGKKGRFHDGPVEIGLKEGTKAYFSPAYDIFKAHQGLG